MVAGPHRSRLAPSDARAEAAAFAQLAERARNLAPRQTNPDDDMSAANFFIPSLPGQPADSSVTMYGGHIPSAPVKNGVKDTDSDAHLYFFMVRNRHIAETERTLLWFNGGPGCSSFDGGLMEIGPFRILPSSGGQLKEVEGAWNEYANVIFIDQPVGTGYSYMATNSYVHELPEAAEHVVEFLWKFYRVFPEFVNHDTYIAGESYAGQYIPYIAKAILESSRIATKLKGLLIGNGWIDPYNQYPAYYDFAIDAGVIKPGSGADTKVKKMVTECMMMLNKKGGAKNTRIHEGLCERILGGITDSTIQAVNGQNMCVNNYDVRLTDTHPACGMNWPPDLFDMHPYLSREDVKSAFHASRHSAPWSECNGQVGAQFYTQSSQPSVHLLPDLLGKVPILMFAGAEDLICNHVGIERMIENLNWNGGVGFGNATVDDWVVNGKQAGTWTTARNLTYVKINEASHMVPYDQPLAAHDMFLRFIGVSLISAAGPAAQVPSRVGTEQEAVLGSTHPNGTALLLDGSSSSSSSDAAAAGQKEVLLADGTTGGESGKAGEGKGLGGDGALEGLVHASSALVLVALMGAAFALFLWFRRRTQRLSRSGEGRMPGLKAHSTPPKSPKSKGKQRASAPSPSSSAFAPSTDSPPPAKRTRSAAMQSSPVLEQDEDQEDENNMLSLAERIADAAHLLVKGRGSDTLAKQARDVVKRSFDSALASESLSFPHLSTLLASLSPSSGPTTRSSASRTAAPEPSASSFTLEETPISELTVEDMDPEMIWEQMELRGRTVDGLMEEMFGQTEEGEEEGEEGEGGEFEFDGEEEEGEEGSSEGEEEEGSEDDGEEPPTPEEEEYFRRLASGEAEEDEDEEESEEDEQEQQELEDPEADATRGLTLDNFDGEGRGKKSRASGGARRSTGPPSAVDDAFFSLHDFHVDADEGEFEMAKMLKGELPSDDDEDDGNDGGEGGIDLFAPVGGLGEDEEQEEEEEGDLDAGGVMYRDFFDPPRRTAPRPDKDKKKGSLAGKDKGKKPAPAAEEEEDAPPAAAEGAKKRGVRFSENVKVKEIPHRLAGRGKRGLSAEEEEDEDEKEEGDEEEGEEDEDEFEAALARLEGGDDGFGEDEDEDEEMRDGEEEADEDEDEEDDIEEGQETIERFKDSLFDDEEDEEKDPKKNLSRHERRLLQLSSQIEALEQENVGKKNWATTGEAQARDRPMDSLLEEDLEFERMGKVAPQVTEETTKGIEELIKKRILDNQFDDVERRRPVDPNALLPSRFMELQDSQSKKSLAEVYEDEFRDARDREQGKEVVNELDKDLQEKHDEIEALFEELAGRLDALSNARFTPKAPKATITTVSNLPSISLESALPTTNSTSTLLAPEEVYSAHARHSALAIDAADLTPAQKKAARQKGREARKSQHEKKERVLEREMKRRGVRGEKEKAEKTLVGLRGVTVLGKGGEVKKGGGVKRKRGEEGGRGEPSGVGLKL